MLTHTPTKPPQRWQPAFTYGPGECLPGGIVLREGLAACEATETYLADGPTGRCIARFFRHRLDAARWGLENTLDQKLPHLVRTLALIHADAGATWLIREHIAGRSLADELARRRQPMPLKDSLRWAKGIAAGLHVLESNGAMHGRLQPGNVWLERGVVKLSDYGLGLTSGEPRISPYLPPEATRGRFDKADLYALGAITVEMLSGRAWTGQEDWPAWIADLYIAILDRAVTIDPAQRYRHVGELIDALDAAPRNVPAPRPLVATAPQGVAEKTPVFHDRFPHFSTAATLAAATVAMSLMQSMVLVP